MRKCERCGKGSRMGGARKLLRGHYNPVNWTRKYPNLQYGKLDGKRARLCTACLRTETKPEHKVIRKVTATAAAAAAV